MKVYNIEIKFFIGYIGSYMYYPVKITVPDYVDEDTIVEKLLEVHNNIDREYLYSIYEHLQARDNIALLLDTICEEAGWSWKEFEYDRRVHIGGPKGREEALT